MEKERWEKLEEIVLWPEGEEDQGKQGEEGGLGPLCECTCIFLWSL